MIKRTIFIVTVTALVACSNTEEVKTDVLDTVKETTHQIKDKIETTVISEVKTFEETEESFTAFTEHFKDLAFAKDTTAIKAFNLSDYKVNELMLDFFRDTNGLVERKADFTPNDMGYTYSSSYAGNIDGNEFESGIYYYFKYNKEKASYDLVNVLAAG